MEIWVAIIALGLLGCGRIDYDLRDTADTGLDDGGLPGDGGSDAAAGDAAASDGGAPLAPLQLVRAQAFDLTVERGFGLLSQDVAVDSAGQIYLVGGFGGTARVATTDYSSTGTFDGFLMALAPDFTPRWFRQLSSTANAHVSRVYATDSEVVCAGLASRDLTIDGVTTPVALTDPYYGVFSKAGARLDLRISGGSNNEEGGVGLARLGTDIMVGSACSGDASFGASPLGGTMRPSPCIVRATSDGMPTFLRRYQVPEGTSVIRAIAPHPDGTTVFIAGHFSVSLTLGATVMASAGDQDPFLARIDATTGDALWATSFGSSVYDEVANIVSDESGHVYLTGFFGGPDASGLFGPVTATTDGYLGSWDEDGNPRFQRLTGCTGTARCEAQALSLRDGELTWLGIFEGGISLGSSDLLAVGMGDLFIASLDPAGAVVRARGLGGSGQEYAESMTADGSGFLLIPSYFQGSANIDGVDISPRAGGGLVLLRLAR